MNRKERVSLSAHVRFQANNSVNDYKDEPIKITLKGNRNKNERWYYRFVLICSLPAEMKNAKYTRIKWQTEAVKLELAQRLTTQKMESLNRVRVQAEVIFVLFAHMPLRKAGTQIFLEAKSYCWTQCKRRAAQKLNSLSKFYEEPDIIAPMVYKAMGCRLLLKRGKHIRNKHFPG